MFKTLFNQYYLGEISRERTIIEIIKRFGSISPENKPKVLEVLEKLKTADCSPGEAENRILEIFGK